MKKAAVVFVCICIGLVGTSFGQSRSLDLQPLNKDPLPGGGFLESEAGISAYGQIAVVDLATIKPVFKNIEKETSQYIIG